MKGDESLPSQTTDFGFQTVPSAEKTSKVTAIFNAVAPKYDFMNDVMSFGIHRWWKRYTVLLSHAKPGYHVCDLAAGTGDLSYHFAKQVGLQGSVTLVDINEPMLSVGRDRLLDRGMVENISYVLGNAENLPLPSNHFHICSMAFGLRNVTHKMAALREIYRILKPGGQALILEFSKPRWPGLRPLYDFYSFKILPRLGQWFAQDAASYQYLVESIRMHPDQETLNTMLLEAGFEKSSYLNLSGGITALHRAYKF